MSYPRCNYRCNGMLNCQQLDYLLEELDNQTGRENTISIYKAMLSRNYGKCPLNSSCEEMKMASSMY